MTSLLDQVAKVIYEEHVVLYSSSPDPWKGADNIAKRKCRKTARLILAALGRKP